MRKRDLIAALMGAAVVLVLAGSVAWAAIPGTGGVIQGCYDGGGNVKVVETLPCPKNYTAFQWNQQGLQGIQGVQGIQGLQGEQGEQGPQGAEGDPGQNGADGAQGPAGEQGPQGIQGLPGQSGAPGANGVSGWEILTFSKTVSSSDPFGTLEAVCPSGKVVLQHQIRGQTAFVLGSSFDLSFRRLNVGYAIPLGGGGPLTFFVDIGCVSTG